MSAAAPEARSGVGAWLALAALAGCVVLMGRVQLRLDKWEAGAAAPLALGAIVLAGVASRLVLPGRELVAPAGTPLSRGEKLFLVGVLLAGGALRLVDLATVPPGGFFDEAQNGLVAEAIRNGDRPVFVAEASQMPALYFYVLAAAISVAGRSVATVRAVSGIAGALTLPLFYLLARRFLAKEAAAAATLLLMLSRWHLNFSRIGFNGVFSPLLEVLAVLALLKALETGRHRYWVALGCVVGLGLQLYYAFNIFPLVLLVVLLGWALRREEPSFFRALRRALPGLALSIGVATLLLLPLGLFAYRNPTVFFARSRDVVIWNPAHGVGLKEGLRRNLIAHAGMFHFLGDANPRHNIPDAPMLHTIERVLLPVGLGAALVGGFTGAVAAAWFLVMLLPGILTIEAPQAYRTIGCLPGLFLLMGGALQLLSRVAVSPRARPRPLVAGAALALAIAAGAEGAVTYFRIQVTSGLAWNEFQGSYNAVGSYLAKVPAGCTIFANPIYDAGYPSVKIHLRPDERINPFRLGDHIPPDPKRSEPGPLGKVFVLDAFENDLVPIFRTAYPNAVVERPLDIVGRPAFVAIRVPPRPATPPALPDLAARGYRASFYPNETFDGEPAKVRSDPAVLFHFHWFEDGIPQPFTADWMTFLEAPKEGTYGFELFSSGPALLLVDGKPVLSHSAFELLEKETGSVPLTAGRHTLVVRFLNHSWSSTIRLWWRPPGGRREVIPLRYVTRPTEAEYSALRPTLPKPAEKKP